MNEAERKLSKVKWVICRICMNTKEDNELKPIFNKDNRSLQKDIRTYGGIKCVPNLSVPDRICTKCLLLLRAAKIFRALCENAEESYKSFAGEFKQNNNDIEITNGKTKQQNGFQNIKSMQDLKQPAKENVPNKNVMLQRFVRKREEEFRKALQKKKAKIIEKAQEEEEDEEDGDGDGDGINIKEFCIENEDSSRDSQAAALSQMDSNNQLEEQQQNAVLVDIEVMEEDQLDYHSTEQTLDVNIERKSEERDTQLEENVIQIVDAKRKRAKLSPTKSSMKTSQKSKTNQQSTTGKKKTQSEHPFICPICGNFYSEKAKLNLHMKIHNKVKPHVCELCGKSFSQTPQLARHMNSHTGLRPYKCKYCSSSFADPSTCIKHQRIHTNERPYKCDVCGKAFGYSNVLKVHILTHTGEKPFGCQYCNKRFTQVHHMKSHEKTHLQIVGYLKNQDDSLEEENDC